MLNPRGSGQAVSRPGLFERRERLQRKINRMSMSRLVLFRSRRNRLRAFTPRRRGPAGPPGKHGRRNQRRTLTLRTRDPASPRVPPGKRRQRNRLILGLVGRMQSRRKSENQHRRQNILPKEFQRPARLQCSWWTRIRAKHCTKKTPTKYEHLQARKNCLRL